ncbi:hypothetical protein H6P81_013424 [Aristolochia fimbriata]|uniref:Uncharacterized protein n=1 Tax=Aristolochia fimbriata TaxID=158543 RepID=A0AAV7EHI5_ARIFI|nr:hypothetical protein H6P81_013424 [Aristolochia fimbriata]
MDRIFVFLAVLLTLKYSVADSAPDSALVTHLPGFDGTIPSKHYAGYLKLNGKSAGKNLYYYFVESEGDPAKDPVVLWLNGGPGCSSFDGFVYENGMILLKNSLYFPAAFLSFCRELLFLLNLPSMLKSNLRC